MRAVVQEIQDDIMQTIVTSLNDVWEAVARRTH